MLHIAADFNMNLLNYEKCKKISYMKLISYQQLISLPESPSKAPPQMTISKFTNFQKMISQTIFQSVSFYQ